MQTYHVKWIPEAKTASYTVTDADAGKLFTNEGDTDAITFTLPAPSAANKGNAYMFYTVADFDLAVVSNAKLVTFNNAAATSVKYGTSAEKIGGAFYVISTGAKWLVHVLAEETQSVTVA